MTLGEQELSSVQLPEQVVSGNLEAHSVPEVLGRQTVRSQSSSVRSRRSLQWFPFFEGLSGVGSAWRNPALLRAGWGAARERWQSTADGGHGPGMCVLEAAAGSVFRPQVAVPGAQPLLAERVLCWSRVAAEKQDLAHHF